MKSLINTDRHLDCGAGNLCNAGIDQGYNTRMRTVISAGYRDRVERVSELPEGMDYSFSRGRSIHYPL